MLFLLKKSSSNNSNAWGGKGVQGPSKGRAGWGMRSENHVPKIKGILWNSDCRWEDTAGDPVSRDLTTTMGAKDFQPG